MTVTTTTDEVKQVREDFNRLRGRLFQALESFGLPEKQEDAAKGIVRRMTYDMQTSLESTLRHHDNLRHSVKETDAR